MLLRFFAPTNRSPSWLVIALLACAMLLPGQLLASEAAEDAAKPYPSQVCLVADQPLGSMGDPYVFVHEGYEIKFCCRGCMPAFRRNTEQFMTKLKAMHAAAESGDHGAEESADE
ncbi:MAG: hypothetical protein EA402_07990 [Planctomycetota bacterium]|nr:MAG: hypothetical protein EA402_07990 [Planctomycetota bacterium]